MLIRLHDNSWWNVAPRAFLLVARRKRARSDAFHQPLSGRAKGPHPYQPGATPQELPQKETKG